MVETFLMKVMEMVPEDKSVTITQMARRSGIDYRTVKKYLDIIAEIQESRRVIRERIGLRIVVRKGTKQIISSSLH